MKRAKWALGFAMMVFGLLLTTQLRVQQQKVTDPSRSRTEEGLDLKSAEEKIKALETERDRLKTELGNVLKGATPTVDTTPIEMLAGTVSIVGKGVIVTVAEAPESVSKTRVRDEDLWMIVNELLAAGAEGISINGQRFTSVSGIRNVGQRVMINQAMTNSPFEVVAVGDPAVMETALRLRLGVIDTLAKYGIKATVARSDSLRLSAFPGPPAYRFAKPVK